MQPHTGLEAVQESQHGHFYLCSLLLGRIKGLTLPALVSALKSLQNQLEFLDNYNKMLW